MTDSPASLRIWTAEPLLPDVAKSAERLRQAEDVRHVVLLPDVHLSKDVCVGAVMATRRLIYPAAVGGDIGCGMAAVAIDAAGDLIADDRSADTLLAALYRLVPSNRHRARQDLPASLEGVAPSDSALEKVANRDGRVQLGTLGRGNHFLEFQADEEQRLWVMVHSGSRGMFDGDVEISDDAYILKAEDAQKLREPPRLAQIEVRPPNPSLKTGEQASFTSSGIDQYGQPISTSEVAWSATGGTISPSGLFTAGDHCGLFNVKALAAGSEGLAEVRIVSNDEPDLPPTPTGQQILRWRGVVPTQKWMNFYTKVLSKLANTPDLKVEVSFEVPLEREQAAAKATETRAGLKDVGLEDGVNVV